MSPDSVIPEPGHALAWDKYMGMYNNAINYTDPTGHETVLCDEMCEQDIPRTLSLAEMADLYGISFTGYGWTLENMAAVLLGVDRVARVFSTTLEGTTSAAEAFKNVYGLTNGKQFEFGWNSCLECNDAGGYTYSSTLIRFQTLWTNNPDRRIPNAIHELGHAFNNLFWTTLSTGERVRLPEYLFGHAQTSIPGFPDRDSTAPNYGYGGPFGFWQ